MTQPPDPSDEALLLAIGSDRSDPDSLREFYLRHVAKVTGMGVKRFDQPEDVADFVATVFLEVLRSARRFDPDRGRAVAWLYGVGTHVAAAMYRQRGRSARAESRLQGRAFLDADDYARVEERIDAVAELRRTCAAMRRLAQCDREVLELVAVDGLTAGEAARALDISPVAARVRLTRARRRLRAMVAADQTLETTARSGVADLTLA